MKVRPELPRFFEGALGIPGEKPVLTLPESPSGLGKLVPGARAKRELSVAAAREAWERAVADHERREERRQTALREARAAHEAECAAVLRQAEEQNQAVENFRTRFSGGDPAAVVEYFSLVLDASRYPDGFPQSRRQRFARSTNSSRRIATHESRRLSRSRARGLGGVARRRSRSRCGQLAAVLGSALRERRGVVESVVLAAACRCVTARASPGRSRRSTRQQCCRYP